MVPIDFTNDQNHMRRVIEATLTVEGQEFSLV